LLGRTFLPYTLPLLQARPRQILHFVYAGQVEHYYEGEDQADGDGIGIDNEVLRRDQVANPYGSHPTQGSTRRTNPIHCSSAFSSDNLTQDGHVLQVDKEEDQDSSGKAQKLQVIILDPIHISETIERQEDEESYVLSQLHRPGRPLVCLVPTVDEHGRHKHTHQ